ncbi:GNAT family N-acetyltransferase [Actinophytocola sp.]|uniref:GNAT family N-acetyltransferase n=1 Tax=Actinophytocola sp. TaxID=1872138 RepID=UPI003899EB40
MSRVRRAVAGDVAELVRLRALLFEAIEVSGENGWRESLAGVLAEQVAAEGTRILVVDGDAGGVAACGVGAVEQRLPGPRAHNGRVGQVYGVVTDPGYRRCGHSRAILECLLGWFRERGVARVDLHASREGEPLYRALGFVDHPEPGMFWWP